VIVGFGRRAEAFSRERCGEELIELPGDGHDVDRFPGGRPVKDRLAGDNPLEDRLAVGRTNAAQAGNEVLADCFVLRLGDDPVRFPSFEVDPDPEFDPLAHVRPRVREVDLLGARPDHSLWDDVEHEVGEP